MKLTREQFIEAVIALEHRNLTLGLELSMEFDMDTQTELPDEATEKIAQFEALQDAFYSTAREYDLGDQFEHHENTGLLTIKPDSELEQIVWDSIEIMERALTYEMIVRQKVIEHAQNIRDTHHPHEPNPEELFPEVEALSKKYWEYLKSNGLRNIIKNI